MPRKKEAAGYRVVRRPDTGALTIEGRRPDGKRVRQRAQSDNLRLAREEAAALHIEHLRTEWHGPRRGVRPFGEAVTLYVETETRSRSTLERLNRIIDVIGDTPLKDVNQELINKLANKILQPGYAPATKARGIIVPVRAVLHLAAEQGLCDMPKLRTPKFKDGRTNYLLPGNAELLLAAAGPALRVLIRLILGTGARMAEALELDWGDVDLQGQRAIFWKTKQGERRNAYLPPMVVAMLADLPYRRGKVIRRPDGRPYEDKEREEGGQVKRAWAGAKARAIALGAPDGPGGIARDLRPHDLRHTWASWHYALYKDPLRLKLEGGWAMLDQVERYCHLLPAGHQAAIRGFWHEMDTDTGRDRLSA
jgi:integrase